ncbi:MAG: GIY-YIG nuclease family protein [Bacteroidota bacterium]
MPNSKYYVYILYSRRLDKYYTGQTSDIGDRFIRHNQDRSKATKGGGHWMLVYAKQFNSRSAAVQYEQSIKSQKSRSHIEDLVRDFYGG